ncbi:MAG: VanW family protein [Lachnospiraceae bacterium]|jgi:vancomycin resistance protein YoaR|nr:VanW family protein [Lachnospiraceae bacterium]
MLAVKRISRYLLVAVVLVLMVVIPVNAEESATILEGVYVDSLALGGMTEAEATRLVEDYVAQLGQKQITLKVREEDFVIVTPAEMDFTWNNQEIIAEAAAVGTKGNVIERYKALKDLENSDKVFPLQFSLDTTMITDIINEQCGVFNQPAIDATMTIIDGVIDVTEGQTGQQINVRTSADIVYDYLQGEWDKEDCTIQLEVELAEPRGSAEELGQLTDVLGSFTTSYSTSNKSRSANVSNGCALINGSLVYPGEEFSSYEAVSPFSQDNGYYMAGSYLNGQVVDSLGGGICQVTTTLYNTVLLAELEVSERHNHSMIVTYVDYSADAAIAESAGKDFRFINNLDYPIYIEGVTTPEKRITFTIYGVEQRPSNRTVEYISETLEVKPSAGEVVYQDGGQPVGYVSVQSAHTGLRAKLWKVVREDGVEISREEVNSSNYMASPRSATVGTSTADPNILNAIMGAIATNNIDHIKNVAAAIVAQTALPPAPVDPAALPPVTDPAAPPATPVDPAAQPPATTDPATQPPATTDPAATATVQEQPAV